MTLDVLVVTSEGSGPETAGAETVTVAIEDDLSTGYRFSPSAIEVAAGTTVTWTNNSAVAHTVSGSDLAFEDSGMLGPGQPFSQTFSEPGTYHYRCDPHSWMTGTAVVT